MIKSKLKKRKSLKMYFLKYYCYFWMISNFQTCKKNFTSLRKTRPYTLLLSSGRVGRSGIANKMLAFGFYGPTDQWTDGPTDQHSKF